MPVVDDELPSWRGCGAFPECVVYGDGRRVDTVAGAYQPQGFSGLYHMPPDLTDEPARGITRDQTRTCEGAGNEREP